MKIVGHVRRITPLNSHARDLLSDGLLLALRERERDTVEAEECSGYIINVQRDLLAPQSGAFSVNLRVHRRALLEATNTQSGTREESRDEIEIVPVFAFPELSVLFFETPELRTREISPQKARRTAEDIVRIVLRRDGAEFDISPPEARLSKHFFIQKIKEVARTNGEWRLTELSVDELEGRGLADKEDLTLYNPNPDDEDIARRILGPELPQLSSINLRSSPAGDLSHNPIARAAAGAGSPKEMRVERAPAEGHGQARKYARERSNRIEVDIEGRQPSVAQQLSAIYAALEEHGHGDLNGT